MKAPRVTLDQWRTLQAVVDHGGFAQAAEALHRSQSSVSYTVARMQDQLGVPLLRIDGRKAVLTDAGEVLLRRSRQLVKNASQLEDLAHHMEQGWEAEVRLVVDAAYPNARLVRALTAFMPQSRGCRVRLREEVLSGVEELLIEGVADLAICGFSIAGYLGTEMSDVEFVAVAHPEHALHRMNRELSFQDLESQMQVVIRDSGRQQPRDVGWLGAEQRWTVGSLATAAAFVGSGLGFAWLPRHMIERELAEGVLKQLPLEQGGSRHPTFYLYSNKDKPLGPATQILVELLRTFDTAPLDAPFAAPGKPEGVRPWPAFNSASSTRGCAVAAGTTLQNHLSNLVISAEHDYTPVAQKEIYVKLLPNARLVVIEDSRHATPLDQPEVFNATLLDFLNSVDATTQDH
ncbi:Transcriptional regulator, LysR family [Pseudomonas sp. R2-37-08W]|nr:Transcriptional regulator, LysR family [Pseudomonas sp. R2-37-08W]